MTCSMQCSLAEAIARICFSRWCTRLWILQEAVASPRLWFKFKDNRLNFQRAMKILYNPDAAFAATPEGHLQFRLWSVGCELQPRRLLNRASDVLFGFLETQFRQTSDPRDELVCVAGTAKFSPQEIQSLQMFVAMHKRKHSWR
jgi:hypothetical protein